MKLMKFSLAASMLALAPAAIVLAPATAVAQQTLSQEVGNPLKEAQSLLSQGKVSAAAAQVDKARAAAKTPFERNTVAKLSAAVNVKRGNFAAAARELESAGASPAQLASVYYAGGNYDKAIAAARKAGGGGQMQRIIGQSYIKKGDFKSAASFYQQVVNRNPNDRGALENLASAQYKVGDKQGYLQTLEKLIKADPAPENWRALLINLKKEDMPTPAKLALYELMLETNNITLENDYQEFAKLAILNQAPGLAKQALDQAVEKEVLSTEDDRVARLIQAADARAQQALKGAQSGQSDLAAANAFRAAGEYQKAVPAYQSVLKTAGGDNEELATIQLGIAQMKAGNSKAAQSTFSTLAKDEKYSAVASLWRLYAETRG